MAYKQLRAPNLLTTDLPGWCLRLVLHAFGFNSGANFARQEWDRNTTKHTDSLPTDVAVPVFYSWSGTIDGVTRDWGDVAIYVPGKGVLGTPQHGSGNANRWDPSVEARRAWLGGNAKYLGWTEQLNGVNLVQRVNSPVQGGQMIIQNADNWYARCNKTHWQIRGRELSRATFTTFVGQDFLHFVEVCSDDPEADKVQVWQTVGKTAVTDKWDQQIYALQAQVKSLSSRPTAEQLQAAQTQADDLAKQVDAAKADAKAANDKAAALEVEHIEAQKTGNAFLLWLGEQLKKLIPGK